MTEEEDGTVRRDLDNWPAELFAFIPMNSRKLPAVATYVHILTGAFFCDLILSTRPCDRGYELMKSWIQSTTIITGYRLALGEVIKSAKSPKMRCLQK